MVEGMIWGAAESAGEIAELEIYLQAARDPALQEDARRAFAAYEEFAVAVLDALGLPSGPPAARLAVSLFTGLALGRLSTGESEARSTYEALIVLARGLDSPPQAWGS